MPQDVHHQFSVVAVRDLQQPVAGAVPLAFLIWVPLLCRDPAGALRREAQRGPLHGFAAEDAVAAAQNLVQFVFGHVNSRCGFDLRLADVVEAEAAQFVALVTPCVQEPIAAVVDQPLRRDGALAGLACATRLVTDAQPFARHKGHSGQFEAIGWYLPFSQPNDADPLVQAGEGVGKAFPLKNAVQSFLKRLDVAMQQFTRLYFRNQVLKCEQCQHFTGLEPKTSNLLWEIVRPWLRPPAIGLAFVIPMDGMP